VFAAQVRLAFGELKGKQDSPANLDRVLDSFQPGSGDLPIIMPKISVPGSGGNDQIIKAEIRAVIQLHCIV